MKLQMIFKQIYTILLLFGVECFHTSEILNLLNFQKTVFRESFILSTHLGHHSKNDKLERFGFSYFLGRN